MPRDPERPCELCYCIKNSTACVMQECTLKMDGCKPIYQDGVCCPVKYMCGEFTLPFQKSIKEISGQLSRRVEAYLYFAWLQCLNSRGWYCTTRFVRFYDYNDWSCRTQRIMPSQRSPLCWWSLNRKRRSLWTLLLHERRYCLCCWTLHGFDGRRIRQLCGYAPTSWRMLP